jgi:hypothetical protein
VKQAIIVPTWLKMSPGKVASQCCHAALKGGQFDDKRVILKLESEAHYNTLARFYSEYLKNNRPFSTQPMLGWFTDSGPTTEGTENVVTVYWIRGLEEDVNRLTGQLELY